MIMTTSYLLSPMHEIKLLASEWLQLVEMKSLFSVKSMENMKSPILFAV